MVIRKINCRSRSVLQLLQIGVPAALQGAVFCFANIFVQAAVNRFGEIAAAGSAIAMNFEYFGYYMITAFGQAATTFISIPGERNAAKSVCGISHLLGGDNHSDVGRNAVESGQTAAYSGTKHTSIEIKRLCAKFDTEESLLHGGNGVNQPLNLRTRFQGI